MVSVDRHHVFTAYLGNTIQDRTWVLPIEAILKPAKATRLVSELELRAKFGTASGDPYKALGPIIDSKFAFRGVRTNSVLDGVKANQAFYDNRAFYLKASCLVGSLTGHERRNEVVVPPAGPPLIPREGWMPGKVITTDALIPDQAMLMVQLATAGHPCLLVGTDDHSPLGLSIWYLLARSGYFPQPTLGSARVAAVDRVLWPAFEFCLVTQIGYNAETFQPAQYGLVVPSYEQLIAWIGKRATSRGQEDDAAAGFYEACDLFGYNFIQVRVFAPFPAASANGTLPANERKYPIEAQSERWGYTLTPAQAKRIAAQPVVTDVSEEVAPWYAVGHNLSEDGKTIIPNIFVC